MVSIIWDLLDYVNHKKELYNIGKLSILAKYSAQLEDDFFKALNPKKGQIAYGDLTTINK